MLVDIIYFAIKLRQLNYLLFSVYLVLATWLVLKIPFFKNSGLSRTELILVFWSKILAGTIYGLVGIYYKITKGGIGRDTWKFHYSALKESDILKSDPQKFFADIKNLYPHGYSGFLSSQNSWWNDLHDTLFVKLLAIVDLFSFGNYYINVIFYSFITLFAPVAFFKIFMKEKRGERPVIFAGIFFIPSVLYWTSGIHKDGIVFLALALIIGGFYYGLVSGMSFRRFLYIMSGLVLLLLFRNFLLVLILPALLAWFLAAQLKKNPLIVFSICYLLFVSGFFLSGNLSGKFNLLQAVVQKQKDFLVLVGQSSVPVNHLQPGIKSFISNFGQAFNLAFLQPSPGSIRSVFVLPAALEEGLLLILFALFLFYRKRNNSTPFMVFSVFFSLSVLFSIGYTVNIIGAIVRYRSIILVLLVVPLLVSIDWQKVKNTYNKIIT
jgi:hypothetical protein